MNFKPVGKVVFVSASSDKDPNDFIVGADIVCKDEAGALWTFTARYMVHDLEPYCETQAQEFPEWCRALLEKLPSWEHCNLTAETKVVMYLHGLTVEQALERIKNDRRKNS